MAERRDTFCGQVNSVTVLERSQVLLFFFVDKNGLKIRMSGWCELVP
jgi:hypothetical protein